MYKCLPLEPFRRARDFSVEIHQGSIAFQLPKGALFFILDFKTATTAHSCF